jgi:F-type H+-transporting ATPase subunit b
MFETGGRKRILAAMIIGVAAVAVWTDPLWAAEASADWRPTYDLVMRWINFGILAGLIFYFGRRPVANLLNTQVDRHRERIGQLEAQRDAALERLAEVQRLQQAHQDHLEVLRQRIVADGERQREALIEDGQREGEVLIAQAHRRIGLALRDARKRLRDEMVDLAVARSFEKLPSLVTPRDNEARVAHFFKAIQQVG